MSSTEIYRTAAAILGPWCRAHGFSRTKSGVLGYTKPAERGFLVFWLQCSQEGWDPYAGSKFVVEFRYSSRGSTRAGARGCRAC